MITFKTSFSPAKITSKKMMQPQLLRPTFSTFNQIMLYDPDILFRGVYASDFPSIFDSSMICSNSYVPLHLSNEVFDLENLETFSSAELEEICKWINANETEENSCLSLESIKNSIILPTGDMEVDKVLSLLHLFRAYGEAVENRDKELAKVIVESINEKSSPMGSTMERVAYNLFKSKEHQSEYLRKESINHFIKAFQVVYRRLPFGRFAHFTANSVILESMPNHIATLHVIDFDIGEGIQWPSLIEALSRKQKGLKLTSIKYEEENASVRWEFEETKKQLQYHAKQYGLKFEVEERSTKDLAYEVMRMKKRGRGKEWLVFNCMVGLPHMGRRRARSCVKEFLTIAEELLANFEGILVLGNGEGGVSLDKRFHSFTSFFDELVRYYQVIFESLERNFPVNLSGARTAIESLFLGPFTCPDAWFEDWEEMRISCDLEGEIRLEELKLSQESLVEAKEMVKEREDLYNVKIEGLREHEMVLRWKETPLVRVSTWM